jgi:hypothetical protein
MVSKAYGEAWGSLTMTVPRSVAVWGLTTEVFTKTPSGACFSECAARSFHAGPIKTFPKSVPSSVLIHQGSLLNSHRANLEFVSSKERSEAGHKTLPKGAAGVSSFQVAVEQTAFWTAFSGLG